MGANVTRNNDGDWGIKETGFLIQWRRQTLHGEGVYLLKSSANKAVKLGVGNAIRRGDQRVLLKGLK